MTVNQALHILLQVEANRNTKILRNRLAVGIARAGSDLPTVAADYAEKLIDFDFGSPLHILVIPADLHFIEAEALVKLAHAPVSILKVDE
jgi:diphthine synthase